MPYSNIKSLLACIFRDNQYTRPRSLGGTDSYLAGSSPTGPGDASITQHNKLTNAIYIEIGCFDALEIIEYVRHNVM